MKQLILALILVVLPSMSWAECSGGSCKAVKVTRMVVKANGDVNIGTSGDESNLTCEDGGHGYIKLEKDSNGFNQVYSLLLTSHTTEHPIWIRANDDSGECRVVYVVSDK
ncbi:hypothetical protein QSV34_07650 [Porticoccus sp. W117]|uniref:hypothetical protein n=1 Tax=Porticoccus sp. W117 TaxID=3054777 RepID=UPI0025972BC1|nr:hypothetical protein [Porticoccus sp. W117]MDM3871228.1 hypothetical protein [Porticoccus sp. W117]